MMTMPKCHDCGRFCRPVAWKMIYSVALPEPQEEIYKCATCAEKNGSFAPQHGIKPEYSCGKFPTASLASTFYDGMTAEDDRWLDRRLLRRQSMRISSTERAKVFTVFNAPKLDVVTVMLQDVGPGCGRLVIECYGSAWAGYWGAMGDRELMAFLLDCDPEYIARRMHPNDRTMKKSEAAYLLRIVEAVHLALRSNTKISGVPPQD